MRTLFLTFTALSAVTLAACGGASNDDTEQTTPPVTEHAEEAAASAAPAAEAVEEVAEEVAAEESDATPSGLDAAAAAFGPDGAEGGAASTGAEASAAEIDSSAILADFGEPYVSADLGRGRNLFRRCQSCHTLSDGARHMVGPNLYGLFGRDVGTAEGFRYSPAVQAEDFVWTPAELDQWLANPRAFLPGNRMSFAGLRNEDDRRDLIAYLAVETHASE